MTDESTVENHLLDPAAKLLWSHQANGDVIKLFADDGALHVLLGRVRADSMEVTSTQMAEFDTIVRDARDDHEFSAATASDIAFIRKEHGNSLGQGCLAFEQFTVGPARAFVIVPETGDEPHEIVVCLVEGEGDERQSSLATAIHRSLISAPFSEQRRPSAPKM